MAKIDEKMQMIGTAVILQAEEERKKIVAEANAIRDRELSQYRETILEKMFDRVQQRTREIRQRNIREKSRVRLEAHRGLLKRREELTESVLSAVRARLSAYAATPEYTQRLVRELAEEKTRWPAWDHSATTLLLREDQQDLEKTLAPILPGCKAEGSKSIRLGGYLLRNEAAGILVDNTLDRRLEDNLTWYLENCGLRVTE